MLDPSPEDRKQAFRAAIQRFLEERLAAKLDKRPPDDPERAAIVAQHQPAAWLADAACRVAQIQAVTHSLKPIHPDARGTNLYCPPAGLPPRPEVGSHLLQADFPVDVVGNAAALDVYKFLRIEVASRSLLDYLLAADPDLLAALDGDAKQAAALATAFASLVEPRGRPASHTLAKQLYWLHGDDPGDDAGYLLLAPLFATSLAHVLHERIRADRFGEEAKAARQARSKRASHSHGFSEYPDLAVQRQGGTKPHNLGQLNSERRGENYLLASLPPFWRSAAVRPVLRMASVLPRVYGQRPLVRETVAALRKFLGSNPDPTMATRDRRDAYIGTLIDELVSMARELQEQLPDDWTADPDCVLVEAEKLWLNPARAFADPEFDHAWQWMDWPREIGQRFGNWLKHELLPLELPFGEVEAREWRKELLADEEHWAGDLHRWRTRLEVPHHIPTGAAP
ncbi:type I-F CRISPR-associated protein Csy1 [Pseudorhodoferax sp.]|uniref:type I-F CRISPR-associated protein Csy1 n=1 Tax=Pseudorhodoferax sp. TaxID=1993553 RepID=UPI002DD65596|nr:type I-F CRISPR-associated protein Csy1 [Pseudorhodoferax sp.]